MTRGMVADAVASYNILDSSGENAMILALELAISMIGCLRLASCVRSFCSRSWDHSERSAVVSVVVFVAGYFVFDRLRDTLAEEV